MEEIKILELFGGIGAIRKAFERKNIPHKVIDYVEIDKYAVASYNAMFNENFNVADIKEWDKQIDVDFIMHGSPCQDFSVAGKQAGGDLGSGTRSSLMYETVRIVGKLRPKYVMWENVKNLLSKKHKHNFDAYIETMNILGYNSYYQVLNAKDYGIPQNRERVYTISIRKDIDKGTFKFPEKEELKLRLKDMLEDNVDEKYYLSDEKVNKIQTSNFMQEKKRIQEKEYSDTILARDWKDPKCVRVGGIFDTEESKHQAGSVYDKDGLAPTLDVMQGGWRQPSIVEEKLHRGNIPIIKTIGNYMPSGHDASRIVDSEGLAPTVKENHGTVTAVVEMQRKDIKEVEKYCEYCGKQLQRKRFNGRLEDFTVFSNRKYCNRECMKRAYLKIGEYSQNWSNAHTTARKINELILHKEVCELCGSDTNLDIHHIDGNWQNNNLDNLMCLCRSCHTKYEKNKNNKNNVDIGIRIRKLTPRETWRLMGFDDEDFEKAKAVPTSNTQLYKQARELNLRTSFRKNIETIILRRKYGISRNS